MVQEDDPAPLCPRCEEPMRLDRVTPRVGGLPELRTYHCGSCGEALTFAEDDD